MLVRIRLTYRSALRNTAAGNRQVALMVSSLMTPLALMAWALGCWRIAADLNWTGAFAITQGLFSHWQVWIAMAIAVQFAAFLLHRYARGEDYGNDDPALS